MSSAHKIALTGVTGALGSKVAHLLAGTAPLHLLVRDAKRAPAIENSTVFGDCAYDNSVACEAAFKGCDTLFMVSGAEHPDRVKQHYALIDAAASAGVRYIVYTSFFGASATAEFRLARDHYAAEEYIKARGFAGWTFLRNNIYMEMLPEFAGADGVIRGPAGAGYMAPVSRADSAKAASVVLRDPAKHAGRVYNLTGSQRLSMQDVADRASAGRPADKAISYLDEDYDAALESRKRAYPDTPLWEIEAWLSSYTAVAKGELDGVTGDLKELLGAEPTSFETAIATSSSKVH